MPGVSDTAFYLGNLPVYWYGICIALGVFAGALVLFLREARLGLPKDTGLDAALWAVPMGLVFARAFYVAFRWEEFAGDPASILYLHKGGLAIYGGLMGGGAALFCHARAKKISFALLLDLLAPALAIGQAIGRWGNFFNQEAYGIAAPEVLCWFPASVLIEAEGGWHLATFFYESLWCLLVFFYLLHREKKVKGQPGDLFLRYGLLYGLERMLVEGLRTDSLYLGPLRVSQLISLVLVLGTGTALIVRRERRT